MLVWYVLIDFLPEKLYVATKKLLKLRRKRLLNNGIKISEEAENVENEPKSPKQPWHTIWSNKMFVNTKDESSHSKDFESIQKPSRQISTFLLSSLWIQFWLSDEDWWPRYAQPSWPTHWAECSTSGPYWVQFVLWASDQRKDVGTTRTIGSSGCSNYVKYYAILVIHLKD